MAFAGLAIRGWAASNGCVRLTNWDAQPLRAAVKAGTKVWFVGKAALTRSEA